MTTMTNTQALISISIEMTKYTDITGSKKIKERNNILSFIHDMFRNRMHGYNSYHIDRNEIRRAVNQFYYPF